MPSCINCNNLFDNWIIDWASISVNVLESHRCVASHTDLTLQLNLSMKSDMTATQLITFNWNGSHAECEY